MPLSIGNKRETRFWRLRRMGGRYLDEKKEKIGIQKHIRITDSDITEQIERVMEHPDYKSFSKAVNDALFYGLPILCENSSILFRIARLGLYPNQKLYSSVPYY